MVEKSLARQILPKTGAMDATVGGVYNRSKATAPAIQRSEAMPAAVNQFAEIEVDWSDWSWW